MCHIDSKVWEDVCVCQFLDIRQTQSVSSVRKLIDTVMFNIVYICLQCKGDKSNMMILHTCGAQLTPLADDNEIISANTAFF